MSLVCDFALVKNFGHSQNLIKNSCKAPTKKLLLLLAFAKSRVPLTLPTLINQATQFRRISHAKHKTPLILQSRIWGGFAFL